MNKTVTEPSKLLRGVYGEDRFILF